MILPNYKLAVLPMALTTLLVACSRDETPAPTPAPEAAEVVGAVQDAVPEAAATAAFRTYLEENYAVDMARLPYTASYRGIKTNHDQWDPVAEAFLNETLAINKARLQQLDEFDRAALAPAEQLSYDLYKLDLERRIDADRFRHHQFVIDQYRGPHTEAPSRLVNIHRVTDLADAEAYIGRLNNIAGWFDEVIAQMAIRTEKNLLLADWQYPPIIEAAGNVIQGAPFTEDGGDSTLWADFNSKVEALDITPEERERLLAEAREALLGSVQPAYERLIEAVEAQAALATGDDGVWKFADGEAFYAERLRWFTTTDLTAEQVHAIGLEEVDRIHDAMREVMQAVEFDGDLREFFEFMRNDPQFYYPNTEAGRAQYLAEAEAAINAMSKRLPEQFGLLPQAELVVKRVEAFRERSAGKAFYNGPPADGSRPGIYYANLYDMNSMPTYQLEALAYHEGVPGHHMQRALSVELESLPEFQRYASFTAFTEGWALYTEELASDMGMYSDAYAEFGRLAMELWRACRLVVDTGLHSKGWTREEAIEYLVENTPNSRYDSTKAIERYIAMPGQATAYLIGKLRIMALREEARTALGEQFDVRAFHDEVLRHGPVPLSILEQNIDRLVANTLATNG
ncbi:MAG: DUF885 domain-containing protein [Halieaceae bacterium]|uniref:DUF885 domain-containing protein n=1 Tax=Haliea alexandrii TaxID=2448162 RepID=UPI000F0B19AC|nr:DUF885 domain-containing protein [Haliea alexandrii]MCR9186035.1 DUF885 domain-containing protein [Halieaceae bacterium]